MSICLIACNAPRKVDDAQYYLDVDQVAGAVEQVFDKEIKVHGFVKVGSITMDGFVLEQRGAELAIRYDGVRPDTLKDRAEVVAVGRLQRTRDGYALEANEVMSKCPDRYQGQSGSAF